MNLIPLSALNTPMQLGPMIKRPASSAIPRNCSSCSGPSYMLINKDEWNKATAAQKALVEASCTAATTRGLAEGEYKNGKVLAEFQDKGVQADQIPRDVLLKLKQVTQEVLEEEAAKDADFKRVYESQQEFMDTYEVWDTRAYVPADL